MTTVGVRARLRLMQSRLYFGSSEADRAESARLIDIEIRTRPCSKGIQFSMRRSRAVKTAQTLVGKDTECARETRLVGDDGADHQPAHLKGDRP